MKRLILFTVLLCAVAPAPGQVSKLNPITNPSLDELRRTFKAPPREYGTGPLWTWNDRLTEEQVRSTIRDLAGQRVRQVWVHPRPGLMTPYLSEEWWGLWRAALDEAEKLDMNVWIYDENSYPSGFGGGFVPEALPGSRGMGLKFEEVEKLDAIPEDVWYVFDASHKNITAAAKKDGKLSPPGNGQKYLVGKVHYTPTGGWFAGKWYCDILQKGVTEKFIEITHEAYKKNIGGQFGKRVPGIFTDEPHPSGAYVGTWVSWNKEIPELFAEKFGYPLIDNLPSLHKPVGDWKKVRHNLHALLLDLFVERWARPNFEWCERNGLEWTGHYWEHGWPGTGHGPDNMAMYIWHQRPAIDLLMNTYNGNSPNAQFGNVRAGKELASVVNQMGRARTLSENYGAGGWDLRFEDMKRLGDWSYAMGVNTLNEHLSYVTIRGARKRDHPQSFSYHAPWFEGYHALAGYFTRLSYMLSQGRQANRIVVIEPTTTAWMYQGEPRLGEIGRSFTSLVNALEHAQVEYDLASEDTIARFGKVADKKFFINLGEYDLVILPPDMENLNGATARLLAQYAKSGGRMICAGEYPSLCDGAVPGGVEVQWLKLIEDLPNVKQCKADGILPLVWDSGSGDPVLSLTPESDSIGSLFHHRRTLPGCEILFLCNASPDKPARGQMLFGNEFMLEEWDLMTGAVKPIVLPFMLQKPDLNATYSTSPKYRFEIPPSGSQLLVLWKSAAPLPPKPTAAAEPASVAGSETLVQRLEPNVLTLDFVDVKIGAEERKDIYTWQANRWVFQKHGFPAGNPWDNQVQFKDELITRKFPADSGFEATYTFTLENDAPKNLSIVIERPDLYAVSCNGTPAAAPSGWWLDRSFGRIDISGAVKPGENRVTITAHQMTIEHEIEPAYLLGDFALRPAAKGFTVCAPRPLALRTPAEPDGVPQHSDALEGVAWLSAGVGFRPARPDLLDRSPSLTFTFGKAYKIEAIRIWNYCERNLQKRGVKTAEVTGLGNIELPPSDGRAVDIPFTAQAPLSAVTFKILSNHAGTAYPIPEDATPADHGFTGLAEVQFLVKDAAGNLTPVKDVTAKASSELVVDNHNRRAQYLCDGSGLGQGIEAQGWHRQGMPFYAGKVAYTRNFEVAKAEGQYSVKLPDSPAGWYGATARVLVNGNDAGFIVSAPWTADVTKFIKQGGNEITVQVYGTPKNLLGPHHAGRLRGSAWPGSFHQSPDKQPAGLAYDVIGYGLFEPFELIR